MAENDNTDEDGQENPNDAQACCSTASGGGDCCSPDSSNSGKSWKMLIFLIIVVAAGVVLARSFIKESNSTTDQAQQLFAAIQPESGLDTPLPPTVTPQVETPVQPKSDTEPAALVSSEKKANVSDKAVATLWGPELDSLASLNKVAAETDAVFILLAAEDKLKMESVTTEVEAAAKKIQGGGSRICAFTLKKDAPNYAQLAKQFSIPCVLAMVKGRGLRAVSGDITEAKLIQAFVMASRPQSGCCPGASSCGPGRAKPRTK
jgi:hypothetical protein